MIREITAFNIKNEMMRLMNSYRSNLSIDELILFNYQMQTILNSPFYPENSYDFDHFHKIFQHNHHIDLLGTSHEYNNERPKYSIELLEVNDACKNFIERYSINDDFDFDKLTYDIVMDIKKNLITIPNYYVPTSYQYIDLYINFKSKFDEIINGDILKRLKYQSKWE